VPDHGRAGPGIAEVFIVLEKGKILERGTHRELLQIEDGIYRGLYKVQNDER